MHKRQRKPAAYPGRAGNVGAEGTSGGLKPSAVKNCRGEPESAVK